MTARHLGIPAILLLGLAGAPVAAQGDSPGCDLRWGQALQQARSGGPRAVRASGYRRFITACPRDSRVASARAAIRAIDPPPPPPPPPPPLLQEAVVDPRGGAGNFTTLQAALRRISNGGTLNVRPGTYEGWFDVSRSVTIRKHPQSPPNEEVLLTGTVSVLGDARVTMQNLHLQTRSSGSALQVLSGEVNLEDVVVDFEGRQQPVGSGGYSFALAARATARLSIVRGRIGPGLTGAMLLSGNARATLDRVFVAGDFGYGAMLRDNAFLEARNSSFDAGIPIWAGDTATLVARSNTLNGRANFYEVYMHESSRFTLENNAFTQGVPPNLTDSTNTGWLFRTATAIEVSVSGNTARSGAALTLPAPRSPVGVHLGTYDTLAVAQAEWSRLTTRLPQLAPVRPEILQVDAEGRPSTSSTRFRLRAVVPNAEATCQAIRQVGGSCELFF